MSAESQLKTLIQTIKTGSRIEVKQAHQKLEKLVHSRWMPRSKKEHQPLELFLDEMAHFNEIPDVDHQMYFINALKWPFLILGDIHFPYFAAFIALVIQHPSGKVRRAVVKATDWLLIATIMDLNFAPEEKWSAERRRQQEETIDLFCRFTHTVVHLIHDYENPKFSRYTYIDSLPASTYKSLNQLLHEVLLRSPFYEKLYDKYIKQHGCIVLPPPPDDKDESSSPAIAKRREELELEIARLLEAANSDFTVEDVKQAIYNEENQDDFTDLLAMFDTGAGTVELTDMLETVQDAWNYFPHKSIGGKAPVEKL